MSSYFEKVTFVKNKIQSYLNEIFKVYGYELLLRIEEYNLLQNENNCIESSTSTGFVMEEFIVSKLETYTKTHNNTDDVKIERISNAGTQQVSYDCFAHYENVFFMINIKLNKKKNNGVAAINILHRDYVENDSEQEKSYLVVKVNYNFGKSEKTDERKILIKNTVIYPLEEIDFSSGHKQDYRNWSKKFKSASGRLQISDKFRKTYRLNPENISYLQTKGFIEKMYSDK